MIRRIYLFWGIALCALLSIAHVSGCQTPSSPFGGGSGTSSGRGFSLFGGGK